MSKTRIREALHPQSVRRSLIVSPSVRFEGRNPGVPTPAVGFDDEPPRLDHAVDSLIRIPRSRRLPTHGRAVADETHRRTKKCLELTLRRSPRISGPFGHECP